MEQKDEEAEEEDVISDDQVAVEPEESYSGREVSFRVKKSMMGRIGGKCNGHYPARKTF